VGEWRQSVDLPCGVTQRDFRIHAPSPERCFGSREKRSRGRSRQKNASFKKTEDVLEMTGMTAKQQVAADVSPQASV